MPKSSKASEESVGDREKAVNPALKSERPSFWRYTAFLLVSAGSCWLDLWTKRVAFERLGHPPARAESPIYWIWEGYFGFQTALNTGALFGIGQGAVLWFAVLSVVALIGIIYWVVFIQSKKDGFLNVTLALITGGILGNLYDRLGLWSGVDGAPPTYAVRDWILLRYKDFTWPNFNVADMLLVCGALLLVLHSFRHPKPKPEVKESELASS